VYVTKWFDQSGNEYNFSQGSIANQPPIVLSGSVVTGSNGLPALEAGSNYFMEWSGSISASALTFAGVVEPVQLDNFRHWQRFGLASTSPPAAYSSYQDSVKNNQENESHAIFTGNNSYNYILTSPLRVILAGWRKNGSADLEQYIDASLVDAISDGQSSWSASGLSTGYSLGSGMSRTQELMFYTSYADLLGIQQNQNRYY